MTQGSSHEVGHKWHHACLLPAIALTCTTADCGTPFSAVIVSAAGQPSCISYHVDTRNVRLRVSPCMDDTYCRAARSPFWRVFVSLHTGSVIFVNSVHICSYAKRKRCPLHLLIQSVERTYLCDTLSPIRTTEWIQKIIRRSSRNETSACRASLVAARSFIVRATCSAKHCTRRRARLLRKDGAIPSIPSHTSRLDNVAAVVMISIVYVRHSSVCLVQ